MLFQYQRLAQPLEPSLTTPQALAWIVQHPVAPPPKRLRQSEWLFAPPPGAFIAIDNGPMAWMVQHPVAPPPKRLRQSEWLADRPLEPSLTTAPPELSWKSIHPDIVFRRKHQILPGGISPSSLDPSGFVVIVAPEYISLGQTAPFRTRQHYWYTQPNPVYFAPIGQPCSIQIALANPGNCLIALANPGDCSIGMANPGNCSIDLGVCG